jgi:hypothetical protein
MTKMMTGGARIKKIRLNLSHWRERILTVAAMVMAIAMAVVMTQVATLRPPIL